MGYNFKSELIFYKVPGNSNKKMSQHIYIDFILEAVVKPWLEAGEDFVLEEDGDSGHGSGIINIARDWKAEHRLKYYFNCPYSLDLLPMENCWQIPKQTVGRKAHWNDETTIAAIKEGWAKLTQEKIHDWVLSMPQRLDKVGDKKGKMTGW